MRHIIFIFLFYGVVAVWAQVDTFLDIGVQNDFLNYRGHGTDRYYTGGNQVAIIFFHSFFIVMFEFGLQIYSLGRSSCLP